MRSKDVGELEIGTKSSNSHATWLCQQDYLLREMSADSTPTKDTNAKTAAGTPGKQTLICVESILRFDHTDSTELSVIESTL